MCLDASCVWMPCQMVDLCAHGSIGPPFLSLWPLMCPVSLLEDVSILQMSKPRWNPAATLLVQLGVGVGVPVGTSRCWTGVGGCFKTSLACSRHTVAPATLKPSHMLHTTMVCRIGNVLAGAPDGSLFLREVFSSVFSPHDVQSHKENRNERLGKEVHPVHQVWDPCCKGMRQQHYPEIFKRAFATCN